MTNIHTCLHLKKEDYIIQRLANRSVEFTHFHWKKRSVLLQGRSLKEQVHNKLIMHFCGTNQYINSTENQNERFSVSFRGMCKNSFVYNVIKCLLRIYTAINTFLMLLLMRKHSVHLLQIHFFFIFIPNTVLYSFVLVPYRMYEVQ